MILALATLWLVACSSGTPTVPAKDPSQASKSEAAKSNGPVTHEILISGFKFQPDTLAVNVGDIVEWKNMDSMPHNAVANDKAFDSGKLKTGMAGKFVVTANDKGTHDYTCTFHPNMKAKLIVQ
jgi:plastocyanin